LLEELKVFVSLSSVFFFFSSDRENNFLSDQSKDSYLELGQEKQFSGAILFSFLSMIIEKQSEDFFISCSDKTRKENVTLTNELCPKKANENCLTIV